MKYTNFLLESAKGINGEERFAYYVKCKGYHVEDVRDERFYQKRDIDFIVEDRTFEVKTDYRLAKTGNIVIELELSRGGQANSSWWHNIEADCLVIMDGHNPKGYAIDVDDLRKILKEGQFEERFIYRKDGKIDTKIRLVLIPLSYLKENPNFVEFDA